MTREGIKVQNEFIKSILDVLSKQQPIYLDSVQNAICFVMQDYNISKKEKTLAVVENDIKLRAIQNFFVAKKVEGLADSSLKYYQLELKKFFDVIQKNLDEITTNDIRYYIAKRQLENPDVSKVTLNNERRVLNSFFGWCQSEDYIVKNPMLAIKMIKQPKRIKKAFSEMEMEKLRESCKTLRDKALVEVLYSTGVRCAEITNIEIKDIDGDQISVIGKGDKERIVYLNAKAQLAVKRYLESRTDKGKHLFVGLKQPCAKMTKNNIERIIRDLGKKAGVENTHPHRFRRTAATLALNRGMPIEQVKQMLGHESIGTTTLYARSDTENVKASHKKYVV